MNHLLPSTSHRSSRFGALAALAALLLVSMLMLLPATRPALASQTFSNTTPIQFNGTGAAGEASPYPSTISVSGLNGSITRVTVTLTSFTNSVPDNVDILLVGPDGKRVILLSDAGGTSSMSAPVTLVFDDLATAQVPDTGPIVGGTFRLSNFGGNDTFPSPGPGLVVIPNASNVLSVYNLTDPNGTWSLYAVEDESGSDGSIASWSLTFETADLEAEVSAAPTTVNAGAALNYDVTVRNRGTESANSSTVTIDIPAGTAFSSVSTPAGWNCAAPVPGGASFTCTAVSFASGVSSTFSVNLAVDQSLAPGTIITRTAAISSSVAEANTTNNSATASTTVTTLADLQVITLDAPASVNAGAEMNIDATVRNNGPSNAAGARVTIPVPTRTTFVSLTSAEGWICTTPAVGAGGEIACTRAVFSTNSASFTLRVKTDATLTAVDTLASSASVASDTPDGDAGNNSSSDTTSIGTTTDLAVTISDAPDPVSAASNLVYTIALTNNGPSNAAGAMLTTQVRSGTTFVALEAPAGWSCSAPAVGNIGSVTCTNPSFGVTTESFRLTVRVLSGTPAGTILDFSATASTATTDSDATNNTDSETTGVTVAADLAVALDGVGPAIGSGASLAYNIRVNNSGPEPSENVTLTSATPANTTFVSLQAPAGWNCTTPAAGGSGAISCTNPSLDVTTDVLVLTVQVGALPNGTAVALTASIQSPTTDTNTANNSATLNSTVSVAADLATTVGGQTSVTRPSGPLSYTIQVRNAGPEAALNARMATAVPAGTTFASLQAPAGWSCTTPAAGATGAIVCTNPSFGVQTATFTLALQVTGSANTTVELVATTTSSSSDPVPANNSDTLLTSVTFQLFTYLPVIGG